MKMISQVIMHLSWVSWTEWAVNILPITAAIIIHGLLTRR